MPLQVAYDASGLDGKLRGIIDQIVANIQVWANQVDGINAAERLSQLTSGVASLPTVQTGVVLPYAGSSAPTGYLLCDGSAVSRTTYANLFAVTGTTYGAGDGSTTFNIPNLRQRFPLGKAASGTGSTLGATGGAIDHTHTGPSHTHNISGSTANESAHTHGDGTLSTDEHATFFDVTVDKNEDGITTEVSSISHVHGISGSTAAGSAHNHGAGTLAADAGGTGNTGTANPPYLVLNYVIKA